MSEKLTRITLPCLPQGSGWMDWGEHTVQDIIEAYRAKARADLQVAQFILQASDQDFQVDVVRGSVVQKPVWELQRSAAHCE